MTFFTASLTASFTLSAVSDAFSCMSPTISFTCGHGTHMVHYTLTPMQIYHQALGFPFMPNFHTCDSSFNSFDCAEKPSRESVVFSRGFLFFGSVQKIASLACNRHANDQTLST